MLNEYVCRRRNESYNECKRHNEYIRSVMNAVCTWLQYNVLHKHNPPWAVSPQPSSEALCCVVSTCMCMCCRSATECCRSMQVWICIAYGTLHWDFGETDAITRLTYITHSSPGSYVLSGENTLYNNGERYGNSSQGCAHCHRIRTRINEYERE